MGRVVTLFALLAILPATASSQEAAEGVLRVSAPAAGMPLRLVRVADTVQRFLIMTRADARVLTVAPAGDYRLRSLAPAQVGDAPLAWDLPVAIHSDRLTVIELTATNATPWDTARRHDAERGWLERSQRSTVRLVAGVTKGTGIYLDTLGGLVLATTDFLAGGRVVAVTGPGTAVAVHEVGRDTAAGLALLRLPAGACAGCAPLRLAAAGTAKTGDPIAVLARVAHQEPSVAVGRVTAAGPDTLATTVAPQYTLAGAAVVDTGGGLLAVLTCDCNSGNDVRRRVIPSARLGPLLAHVGSHTIDAPSGDPLPAPPEKTAAMLEVRALADTATLKAYERFTLQDAGKFRVSLVTPGYLFAYLSQYNRGLERKPELQSLPEETRVARSSAYARTWVSALGDLAVPVVAIDVTPDAGESTGGLFRRALVPTSTANVRFKGDVQRVEIFRNGTLYQPIAGARLPLLVDVGKFRNANGVMVNMRDSTTWGYYLLPPELLAPDSAGAPPSIVVKVYDARKAGDVTDYEFRADVVARAWNDFAPYYKATRAGEPFPVSYAGRFKSRLRDVRANE